MNVSELIERGYSPEEPQSIEQWAKARPKDIDPSWEPEGENDKYPVSATPRLYHYTPLPGLRGIVETGTMWASDLRTLNDETEYEHGLTIIRKAIQDRLTQAAPGFEAEAVKVILNAFEAYIPRMRFFITSYSEVGDVLSQWRGYGQDAGVSIGFRFDELKSRAAEQRCQLVRCIYSNDSKVALINQKVDNMIRWMKSFLDQGRRWEPTVLTPLYEVSTLAAAFKHRAFREEREWRVITGTNPPTIDKGGKSRFEFSLGDPGDTRSPKPLGFDHVIIGPTARHDDTFQATVRNLLEERVLGWETTPSKVPYRTV